MMKRGGRGRPADVRGPGSGDVRGPGSGDVRGSGSGDVRGPATGWRSPATDDLLDTILALRSRDEAERFFRDLCTLAELHEMTQRWQVVRLLDEGRHYAEISHSTGVSTATITRIAQWLRHGEGGYRLALKRRPS